MSEPDDKIDPQRAVDFIRDNARALAKAKAERIYLEAFLRAKKALLMKEIETAGVKSIAAQERDAYAHPEYAALLDGLKEAVAVEEELRWKMVAAQARTEVWRSQEASSRMEDKVTR